MNNLASYNWLKEYIDTNMPVDAFAKELSLKSMSVESIEHLRDRFAGIVIGQIEEVKAHPDADKLRIAITNIGKNAVEIVCGGSNLAEGMRVVVALPGSKVRWHGEGDLIEMKESKIRGVKSFGMICAPSEVGFEKVPCGPREIWDVTQLLDVKPGTSFVDAFDMDDVLLDVEITSNRPECMGMIGLAREGAAAIEAPFTYTPKILPENPGKADLSVKIQDGDLCPRYMAAVISGVHIGPSPVWLQKRLLLAGQKPINNLVDITNYIRLMHAQPMHTFDYDKLHGKEIVIRRAKKGESLLALDDVSYELTKDDLVIADGDQPSAIAGVMGGKESGTWDGTTTVVLEAASFEPVSVRRTARRLNLYSDSQLIFEKGLSSEALPAALAETIALVQEIAGGELQGIVDERATDYQPLTCALRPDKVRALLGVDIADEDQVKTLERLGFIVAEEGGEYVATVPYWRDHDIEHEIDLAEEIARMYGYHNMPAVLPESAPPAMTGDADIAWEYKTKQNLAAAGYTELYGLSFIGERDLALYGIDLDDAVKMLNPLSSELGYLRPNHMPALLRSIEQNQGETPAGKVFDLSRVYIVQEDALPIERTELVIAQYGVKDGERAFRELKGVIEHLLHGYGIDVQFDRLEDDAHWHPTRAAVISFNDMPIGTVGQVSSLDQQAFGIDKSVFVVHLDFWAVVDQFKKKAEYTPVAEFPAVTRDIACVVERLVNYDEVADVVRAQSGIIESVDLVETYMGKGIPDGQKSLTMTVTMRSPEKTLDGEYVEGIMKAVEKALQESFDAQIR